MAEPASDSVAAFFAMVLIAVGGLLLALSGLCTGMGVVGGLVAFANGGVLISLLAAAIGAIPILIGYGLLRWGLSLWRGPQRPPARPPANFTEQEPPP